MRKPLLAGAVAFALLAPSAPMASWAKTAPPTRAMRADAATQNFVDNVWNINDFEIEAGQQAQKKANSDEFVEYGRMIARDHVKAVSEVNAILKEQGLSAPDELDSEHKTLLQRLSSATGARFEEQFRKQQISGHEKAIKLFQNYAKNGQNDALKTWAQNTLPTLENHLRDAEALPHPVLRSTSIEQ